MNKPATVDQYIAGLAPELREIAQAVRATVSAALPEASETISYGIPAYRIGKKTALFFAVWKKHVGLYPIAKGPDDFEARLAPYRDTKATVQLPLKASLPYDLIAEIARRQAGL
jgi:uncharacterized protein YdhG (YjbR/CyaY superfamily)